MPQTQPSPQPQPQPQPLSSTGGQPLGGLLARPRRWRHRFGHSLQWRLVALFLLLALGSAAVFMAGTRQAFGIGWRELVRPLVNDYVDRLAADIGSPPDVARAQAIAQRLPVSIRIDGPLLHWHSDNLRRDHGPYDPYNPNARSLLARDTADGHRIVFGLASWRSDQPGPWWSWWAWWPVVGLLGLTAAAFAYVRHLFKPVDDIRAGALRFGAGDFVKPIPLRRRDELGDLAQQVNQMAANLQRMLEGQRGLLLAISHELRSPLTRARLNAELVPDGAERDALVRDLALMRDLIADLLEGERLAAGAAALQTEPTDLKQLVQDEVQAVLAARADSADVRADAADAAGGSTAAAPPVSLDLAEGLPLLALDRARMALLVRNLLGNALQHGGGSAVQIGLKAEAGHLTLCVRDHGPGVDGAHLARLAEPFYRPDAARGRSSGGVGLGLYLCRLVARSHGGQLLLSDAAPGLRACLTLPLPPA